MIGYGALYPVAFDVYDDTGTLAHAATVTLTITLPDGTTATPSITDDVTGKYRLAYQTTLAGRYTLHASTTGPVTTYDDEFDVSPTPWLAIVSLADAKAHLRMDPADTSEDDELRGFIAATTGAVELYKHEIIARRSVTDEIEICGGGWSRGSWKFRVWSAPVISLTSVVAWDASITWDVSQMRVSESGLVRVMGGLPVTGLVDVTYLAGYQVIPDHYRQGGLVVLQHAWESQRGGGTMSSGVIGPEEVRVRTVSAFTVPNKAKEYLGPPRSVVA